MKLKRLTKDNADGTTSLVKLDMDLSVLAPSVAKVLNEEIERLAELEKQLVKGSLVEIPYALGKVLYRKVNDYIQEMKVCEYILSNKDCVIKCEIETGIYVLFSVKEIGVRIFANSTCR